MIAAALSIRDPRERPEDQLDQANAAHKRFDVAGQRPAVDRRPVGPPADAAAGAVGQPVPPAVPRRVRQLPAGAGVAGPASASCARSPATSASARATSRAIRTTSTSRCSPGCCRTSGCATTTSREFKGARGSTFTIARGSVLARRPPRWVMAAELVETNRLWARARRDDRAGLGRAARRPPRPPLVRRAAVGRRSGRGGDGRDGDAVRAADRQRPDGRRTTASTAAGAREMFVRHALVDGEWSTHHAFVARNRGVPRPRARASRRGCAAGHLLDDDELLRLLRRAVGRRRHVGAPLRPVVEGRRGDRRRAARPHRRRAGRPRRVPPRRLPGHVAAGRPRAAAVVPLRPGRPARRRVGARPADRAEPRRPTRASTGRSPATGPSSSTPSCARCPRTCGAS